MRQTQGAARDLASLLAAFAFGESPMRRITFVSLAALALLALCSAAGSPGFPEITLMRTPNGGIEPRAIADDNCVARMIYFKGDASKARLV